MLLLGARDRPQLRLWDSPLQVVVGLIILAAALSATVLRNRLAAVLLVGVTGYGCGVIFVFHGAPDLALTQFLVETLTLVIFVLVLRDAARRGRPGQHEAASTAARAARPRGRCERHHARGLRDGRPHHHAARRPPARRRLLPRQRREHRQRAARRHPRLGHHGRDLGAARGRDGCRIDGVPAQTVWRGAPRRATPASPTSAASRTRDEPGGRRHHLAAR